MRNRLLSGSLLAVCVVLSACTGADDTKSQAVEEGTEAREPTRQSEPAGDRVVVPDVVGSETPDATTSLEAAGFDVATIGAGDVVKAQVPSAGISVLEGSTVTLTLEQVEPEGTRDDPYPFGTTVAGSSAAGEEATILLDAAVWDSEATVMAENQFNDPAPEGHSWVLLPVTISNIGSEDAIVPWLAFDVSYVTPDGRSFDEASAVIPEELSDVGDLYEGGVGTGNLAYVLPRDAQGGVWAIEYGWSDPIFVAAG